MIGQPLARKEDARFLTGAGRFTDDLQLEGQAYAAMVRSPHAHARIERISIQRAQKIPGVLGVFTGADCAADGLRPVDHSPMPSTKFDMKLGPPAGRSLFYGPHLLLPIDKARHAGEAVTMVVARTQDEALDAAELVDVHYEPLPAVTHAAAALEPGAPKLWDEAPDNVLIDTTFGDVAATERAFAAAAHVVRMDFHVPRVTACPLEPRAALGGGVDAAGRILAQALSESTGKPFVIENRGGANGNIGTEAAAHAAPEGHTLLFTGAGLVTNPSLYKKVPYDPVKDFEPVSLMALGPNILAVHPSLPVHSVRELIAAAKARPGRIGFAGAGSGSTPHLAGELFNSMAGVQMLHVPYRGSGPAMIGLLAGDAPVMFIPAINAGPHIAARKLRALAVTSRERLAAFPDLPTVAESGLPGYESAQWYGLLAPAGTPTEVLDFLNARIAAIMRTPQMKARMVADGLVAIGGTRGEFAAHIRAEGEKWARIIRASGATVD